MNRSASTWLTNLRGRTSPNLKSQAPLFPIPLHARHLPPFSLADNFPSPAHNNPMRNITLSISDETYRNTRIWAAENNTSISAAVEYLLDNLREILRGRKLPRQPRRNNRFPAPLLQEFSREEIAMVLKAEESGIYPNRPHGRTDFVQL